MRALLLFLVVGAGQGQGQIEPFVSEDGSFSALFPGPPIHDTLTIPTPEGSQVRHVFRYSDDKVVLFLWHDCFPPRSLPSDPQKVLDLARQNARNNIPGTTSVSERPIQVSGRPGREFVDELHGQRIHGRAVLGYDGAFYSVGANARSQATEGNAMAFLRSFKVLPPSPRALCRSN